MKILKNVITICRMYIDLFIYGDEILKKYGIHEEDRGNRTMDLKVLYEMMEDGYDITTELKNDLKRMISDEIRDVDIKTIIKVLIFLSENTK